MVLLWLWCSLVAIAPIQLLDWELPYATCMVLKRKKKSCISLGYRRTSKHSDNKVRDEEEREEPKEPGSMEATGTKGQGLGARGWWSFVH